MNLIMEIIDAPAVDILQRSIRFDTNGGTIGRSKEATWRLNDPSKLISNLHAEITFKNGQYYITDTSKNGTFFKTPYKKLIKGTPVPLTQKSAIMIGDYVIAVKTTENDFTPSPSALHSQTPPNAGIADAYFTDNPDKQAYGVIESSPVDEKDITSLLGSEQMTSSTQSDMLLPELDDILNEYSEEPDIVMNDSLGTHIEPPTLETVHDTDEKQNSSSAEKHEDTLSKILSLKLGIDLSSMEMKDQESFVSELADLVLTTLDSLRNSQKAIDKIQKQLGVSSANHNRVLNPLKTAPNNKEIFQNLLNYSPSIAHHIKDLFHELDTHTIAFYTAHKNLSLRTAEKFSPEKLYFKFEKNKLLDKNFSNKKALAWEAYCTTFKYLDSIDEETLDLTDLQKEYKNVLETLNLGYNT